MQIMADTTLSVIIPVYNSSATLFACLRSIQIQQFQDYEVIIVDGCSKDDSCLIAEAFKAEIPGMIIISEPDKGIYDAMNKGIRHASGEWVYFLGSDDVLFNENTFKLLFDNKSGLLQQADIVFGNVVFKELNSFSEYHANFDLIDFMDTNINHQSLFYRKSVFDRIGLYSLDYPVFADWEFNIRCFYSGMFQIIHIKDIIACYSLEGTSNKRKDAFIQKKDDLIFSLIKQKPYSYTLKFANKRNKKITRYQKWKFGMNKVLIKIIAVFC